MIPRLLLSLLVLAACGPAVVLSLSMSLGGAIAVVANFVDPSGGRAGAPVSTHPAEAAGLIVAAASLVFAWGALVVMAVAWIRQRRVRRIWPIAGTGAALTGLVLLALLTGPMLLLMGPLWASPGIAFAVVLCRYHLGTWPAAATPEPSAGMQPPGVAGVPGASRTWVVWALLVAISIAVPACLVF